MSGGTDEASSIAPSSVTGVHRSKSGASAMKRESHSQKILRQMQERQVAEQQQKQKEQQILMQQREDREKQQRESLQQRQQIRPHTSARSSVSHVQQLQSAQPSRPGSRNALSRYSSGTGVMEDAGRSPRKKKSFGRLVDRLKGMGRNSVNVG